MLITIPDVLSHEEVAQIRAVLDATEWQDGKLTAGSQAAIAKRNQQIDPRSETAFRLGQVILSALSANGVFLSAALPRTILPPMFNRYETGEDFGIHVDNAIRINPATGDSLRTDLSATLFLSEPDEYDGGVLSIETEYGAQEVKLPAGHMVLYPSTSLHCVTPVTRGARIASFFWLQSMVRDEGERSLLFDLDQTIQQVSADKGAGHSLCVSLTGIYHNLIRRWAQI